MGQSVKEHALIQGRARGCLMGQLVGDALGSIVEFKSAGTIHAAYPLGLREMTRSPCTARLPDNPLTTPSWRWLWHAHWSNVVAHDQEHVAGAYADWYESDPFDIGATISQALRAATAARAAGTPLVDAACAAASRHSQANGALMRHSPLAIWGLRMDAGDLDSIVRADTMLTHPHPVYQASSAVFIGSSPERA